MFLRTEKFKEVILLEYFKNVGFFSSESMSELKYMYIYMYRYIYIYMFFEQGDFLFSTFIFISNNLIN